MIGTYTDGVIVGVSEGGLVGMSSSLTNGDAQIEMWGLIEVLFASSTIMNVLRDTF